MRWSDFDIVRLIGQLLPIRLRRLKTVLWLNAVLTPLKQLKQTVMYKMQHDCRVIYLEKVLNETFNVPGYDPNSHQTTKKIYIGPGEIPDEVYIFKLHEPDTPPWLDADNVWLHTQEEINEQYCDFTVVVPDLLQLPERVVRRIVDYYKLAGKKYKIITV